MGVGILILSPCPAQELVTRIGRAPAKNHDDNDHDEGDAQGDNRLPPFPRQQTEEQ